MKHLSKMLFLSIILFSCQNGQLKESKVITTDIDNFWIAYDLIRQESDSLKQIKLLEALYLKKGTPGLEGIIEAKRYRPEEFVEMINHYPKFLESVKSNTFKAAQLSKKLEKGINKLKDIYPELKPAKIYFTIGAMRSGGTTKDSLVLIGSELAMVDEQTDISEFEGGMKNWATNYIATKPLENIILLNVHEYVHTQQNPIPNSLLYQCLWEGVAEFVSTKAMEVSSASPAIDYGKNNPKVIQAFEHEMFYERTNEWLWSNAPNQFEIRDLGYYIGYEICERHYESASDKKKAIEELIEIDYSKTKNVDAFIDETKVFTQPLTLLRAEDEKIRPKVMSIKQFQNNSKNVAPNTSRITIVFSEPMNIEHRGFEFGPLGEQNVLRVQNVIGFSDNGMEFTFEVKLKPNKQYQSLVSNRFQSKNGIPLNPYLIDFKTKK